MKIPKLNRRSAVGGALQTGFGGARVRSGVAMDARRPIERASREGCLRLGWFARTCGCRGGGGTPDVVMGRGVAEGGSVVAVSQWAHVLRSQ